MFQMPYRFWNLLLHSYIRAQFIIFCYKFFISEIVCMQIRLALSMFGNAKCDIFIYLIGLLFHYKTRTKYLYYFCQFIFQSYSILGNLRSRGIQYMLRVEQLIRSESSEPIFSIFSTLFTIVVQIVRPLLYVLIIMPIIDRIKQLHISQLHNYDTNFICMYYNADETHLFYHYFVWNLLNEDISLWPQVFKFMKLGIGAPKYHFY